MRSTRVAAFAVALLAGLAVNDAEARGRNSTRTLRMTAPADESPAAGRMQFRGPRGRTFMSATFSRLTPDTLHTVHWVATGEDGPQFMTDRRGRAKLRHVAVPSDAATGTPQVSVTDENGDEVLACNADSMPGAHDGAGHGGSGSHADHHATDDAGGHGAHQHGSGTGDGSGSSSDGMMTGSGSGHSSGSSGGMMGGSSGDGTMHR